MNAEQVQKSIRQMKSFFLLVGILQLIGFFGGLVACVQISNNGGGGGIGLGLSLFLCPILALGFSDASRSLKSLNPKSYSKAFQASIVLLIGFPVFTYFGISYLSKLTKPEMKSVFGKS